MSFAVSRLTLYAIISAIEVDLRRAISLHFTTNCEVDKILGPEIYAQAMSRLEREQGTLNRDPQLEELLPYLDFSDAYKVLNFNARLLPKNIADFLKSQTQRLDQLAAVRNRVMHARPLNFDDVPRTLEYAAYFAKATAIPWTNLQETLEKIKSEPSSVLGLSIPVDEDMKRQSHNLPTPDFDETGFLGRESQIRELIKLCFGAYPVVTIFGEGGVGKTALVLKVAYELLDRSDSPFDAIVWTSAKTARLTVQEVVQIEGAITDSLGLLRDVAGNLAGENVGEAIDEVLGYLAEFKILLILDNLETVLDERIRSFLARLPTGSKILITSRIGLGAFDYPYKLQALTPGESVQLLRALAEVRGLANILQVPNRTLEDYCVRMKHNPGYIKWFVSAVQSGKRPEEALAKPDIFLDFCMTNVYEYLGKPSKEVLQAMLSVPGKHGQAEIVFLTNLDVLATQQALQQLITTNFVLMTSKPVGASFETAYNVSELAREFLAKHYPPTPGKSAEILKRKRQLIAAGEKVRAEQGRNPYSYDSITTRSAGDLLIARYLLDALKSARKFDLAKANEALVTAKSLAPDFFEVYRVEAIVRFHEQNLQAARDAYENAINLEPKSAPLRLWYANLLMRYFDDLAVAEEHLRVAQKLDPEAEEIKLELARVAMYSKKFKEAEVLLHELSANLRTCGGWMQRKYNDLFLSFYQRRADMFAQDHDWQRAVEVAHALRAYFDSIPSMDVDDKMRNKLAKAVVTLMQCLPHLENIEERLKTGELIGWMKEASGNQWKPHPDRVNAVTARERKIEKLGVIHTLKSPFGFIKKQDGERVFFHFSELLYAGDREELRLGSRVVFDEVHDLKGRTKAVDVRIKR
jgi:LuxR family glucitol operon transcriptional activator